MIVRPSPRRSANTSYRSDSSPPVPEVSERRIRLHRLINQFKKEVITYSPSTSPPEVSHIPTTQSPALTNYDNKGATEEDDVEKELTNLATAFQKLLTHGPLASIESKSISPPTQSNYPQQQGMFICSLCMELKLFHLFSSIDM